MTKKKEVITETKLNQIQVKYAITRIDEIFKRKTRKLTDEYRSVESAYKDYKKDLIRKGAEIIIDREKLLETSDSFYTTNLFDVFLVKGAKSFEKFKKEYKQTWEALNIELEKLERQKQSLKDSLIFSSGSSVLSKIEELEKE
jgi:hypothetical protein